MRSNFTPPGIHRVIVDLKVSQSAWPHNSEMTLQRRVYEATSEMARQMGKAAEDTDASLAPAYRKIGTGDVLFCGNGSPLTQASRLFFESDFDEKLILEVEEFFGGRAANWEYIVTPFQSLELLPAVFQRGWTTVAFENVMALDLTEVSLGSESEVQVRVVGPDEIGLWADIAMRGFFGDDVPEVMANLGPIIGSNQCGTSFLAFLDDVPVASASLSMSHKTVYLGGAATLPDFRGRGAQTALLQARLAYAAQLGCDLALCECVPGSQSQRNQERAGFNVVYTKLVVTRPS